MLRPDLVIIGVEILEIACAGVHGADAETNPAVIEQIEIDKRKQRFPQRAGVIESNFAGFIRPTGDLRRGARREEARNAESRGHRRTGFIEEPQTRIILRNGLRQQVARCLAPKSLQAFDAPLGRIPADDRAINRANRYACDPVHMKGRPLKRLIGAGLVRAQRAAALKDKRYFLFSQDCRRETFPPLLL